MFKLMVVAGPNRGSSYPLRDGENLIGRQAGNSIVLPSSRVSKRHCLIAVNHGQIEVQDQGSSNGTFINGVLTKAAKVVKVGDKISVGEYVLEVVAPVATLRAAPAISGLGGGLQFPSTQNSPGMPAQGPADSINSSGPPAPPANLKTRLLQLFDGRLMPYFYDLIMKNEWRMVALSIFSAFVFCNVVVAVYPLLEVNRDSVIKEVSLRARYIARVIADSNAAAMAAKAESRTDVGIAENAENVRVAVLTDLDNRIIAPAGKVGQHLATGPEARIAVKAAAAYRQEKENGFSVEADDGNLLVAVEPVKVLSPKLGRNIVIGMAIVSVDSSQSTLSIGDIGNVYSKTMIFSAILAALAIVILYRITMKPFYVLNEDMDKVLKGEMPQVTHEFKFEELNALWDLINSSLQRIPKNDLGGGASGMGGGEGPTASDYVGPFLAMASAGKLGLIVLDSDRKIAAINPLFEEISGIRADSAVGQEIATVARDQAMGAMTSDLFDRAATGTEGVTDNFDFSGISYKVYALGMGRQGDSPKCFVLAAAKND